MRNETAGDGTHQPQRTRRRLRVGLAALASCVLTVVAIAVIPSAGASATTSIFDDDLVPSVQSNRDDGSVELGVRFSPSSSGRITALRYYQGSADLAVTRATLWSASGDALAKASFAASDDIGWRTVALDSPVKVAAGQTYVASYHAWHGAYPSIANDLAAPRSQNGFTLPASAGVYTYSTSVTFPTSTYRGTNYLADVDFVADADSGAAPAPRPTTTTTSAAPSPTPTKTSSPSPTATPTSGSGSGVVVLGRSFPSSATTGVPAGTSLGTYTGPCTIQTDGVVIDAKTINCDMRILAQNVKITRSVINGTIYSDPDYFNGSFSLTDSEVRMPQSTGTGIGDVNFVVKRVEVTGGSRSINCAADCTVEDSYLHGQYTDQRGIDHESAVRMGSNSVIRHNNITCTATPVPPDSGCSAALTGYGDFAIVQKNTIDDNLIDGGPYGSMGYCTYGGSTTGKPFSKGVNNIKFTDNVFRRGPNGKCGIWGPVTSFDSDAPGNVWTNNLWDDGKTVPPAN